MTSRLTFGRLQRLLGDGAVIDQMPHGPLRAAPRSEAECALLLRTASASGWRVRIEGTGSWMPPDGPADLVVSTRELRAVRAVKAADLVATIEAGATWETIRHALADHGVWLALDPPGATRSLGSLLATASAGPLRAGFGPVRDHILGLTCLTGDGRTVTVGGTVVKNVAGYDLAKVIAGSFGAFGVITSAHLRLRAVPRADVTLLGHGTRDTVLESARRLMQAGLTPASLELFSPAAAHDADWTLAIRSLGTPARVDAERETMLDVAGIPLRERTGGDAAAFWQDSMERAVSGPATLRIGTLPDAIDRALDLVAHHLDEAVRDWISVTVPAGTVRWTGRAEARDLGLLRAKAAEQEMPLTIERAPWEIRESLGHFGAYREGVTRIVDSLRRAFDPAGILAVPLGKS